MVHNLPLSLFPRIIEGFSLPLLFVLRIRYKSEKRAALPCSLGRQCGGCEARGTWEGRGWGRLHLPGARWGVQGGVRRRARPLLRLGPCRTPFTWTPGRPGWAQPLLCPLGDRGRLWTVHRRVRLPPPGPWDRRVTPSSP